MIESKLDAKCVFAVLEFGCSIVLLSRRYIAERWSAEHQTAQDNKEYLVMHYWKSVPVLKSDALFYTG